MGIIDFTLHKIRKYHQLNQSAVVLNICFANE